MSVYELKAISKANKQVGQHFFDKGYSRFRIKNIITTDGKHRVFVWPVRGAHSGNDGGPFKMFEFIPQTGKLIYRKSEGYNFTLKDERDRFFEDVQYKQILTSKREGGE